MYSLQVKDYYDIIKNPMDLQKIKSKIADNKYELRQEFLLVSGACFALIGGCYSSGPDFLNYNLFLGCEKDAR